MKRAFFLLVLAFMLTSCSFFGFDNSTPVNDNFANVTKKNLPFTNLSKEFDVKGKSINTYYINDEDVPYVDILNYFTSLDGYITCNDSLKYTFYINKNMLVLYYYSGDYLQNYVQFQWDKNLIYFNNFSFVSQIICNNQITNFNRSIKYINSYSSNNNAVTFNLGAYYFDILYWNSKCLIPFFVANILFNSQNYYNLYYTTERYYGFYSEIDQSYNEYKTIYTNNANNQQQTKAMRTATVNSFLFAMDYFYGLSSYKDIKGFKNYISNEDIELLLSTNSNDNHIGLKHVIYNQLDELHTRIDGRNIYSSDINETIVNTDDCGSFLKQYYSIKKQQRTLRKNMLGEEIPPVRYYGDTAIITIDSFLTAPNSSVYDSDGNIKDTAWKYDTYFLMRYCINDIKNHNGINDVLIDLSLNGGGSIAAMQRALGFITDKVLYDYSYNTLTDNYSYYTFKVDTDGDGLYDDDAYNQYRWTVLTSINTFSAANDFVCKVKNQGLAKIIGNNTGGGMCSTLPIVLADGTPITISSNNTLRYFEKKDDKSIYYSTEEGFKPNLVIPYSDYYDDSKMVNYIDEVYN